MTYLELLLALLPPGFYSLAQDSSHARELGAAATVLEAAEGDGESLVDEIIGDRAVHTLGRWEALLGLHPEASASTTTRQAEVVAALLRRPSLTPAYIIEVVGQFVGYAVTLEETGAALYDVSLYDVAVYGDAFEFVVVLPYSDVLLAGTDVLRVQHLLDRLKPAHTRGIVAVSGALYDDPLCLYDHCLYGP